jgi:hypothetical protein
MDDDLVFSARYEVMEDEICLRGRRLSERIHEVERALTILAEETNRTLHGGGPAGIEVLAARVLDRFEQVVHDVDVPSIRREARDLGNMKSLASVLCGDSERTSAKAPLRAA